MTGLEAIQDLPEVKRYLYEHQLTICTLMPGWKGWDTPHLMHREGGIIPTSLDYLRHDVRRWQETGKAWRVSMAS